MMMMMMMMMMMILQSEAAMQLTSWRKNTYAVMPNYVKYEI
jgi:hypothetical protein